MMKLRVDAVASIFVSRLQSKEANGSQMNTAVETWRRYVPERVEWTTHRTCPGTMMIGKESAVAGGYRPVYAGG